VIRDFVDPGPKTVLLDLPTGDGQPGDDPRTCSSAALFRRFAREFRLLSPQRGFAYEEVAGAPTGRVRFRLSHKLAAEFVLRKDYRTDWESETQEEYTYFTQAQFEDLFRAAGLARAGLDPGPQPVDRPQPVRGQVRALERIRCAARVPGDELRDRRRARSRS
jgi:hypothetical protein